MSFLYRFKKFKKLKRFNNLKKLKNIKNTRSSRSSIFVRSKKIMNQQKSEQRPTVIESINKHGKWVISLMNSKGDTIVQITDTLEPESADELRADLYEELDKLKVENPSHFDLVEKFLFCVIGYRWRKYFKLVRIQFTEFERSE